MNAEEFLSILASFADSTKEVEADKSIIIAWKSKRSICCHIGRVWGTCTQFENITGSA